MWLRSQYIQATCTLLNQGLDLQYYQEYYYQSNEMFMTVLKFIYND